MTAFLSKLKSPYYLCLVYLIILSVSAATSRIYTTGQEIISELLIHLIVISVPMLLIPYVLNRSKLIRIDIKNTMITGLILFLILDPSQKLFTTAFIGVSALTFKLFARYKFSPVINPAVSGLIPLLIIYIIQENDLLFVSWWGASFIPRFTSYQFSIATLITLPMGVYLALKTNRLPVIISATIFSTILLTVSSILSKDTFADPVFLILEGTFIFAVTIMLSEPKTSPNFLHQQIIYSLIFSASYVFFILIHDEFGLIYSIIIANFGNFIYKIFMNRLPQLNTAG